MDIVRITDPRDLAPGISDTFGKACGELNAALEKFQKAQAAELKYQIQYLMENIQKAGIKDYGITDPVSNIESLVYQLFHDKK